MQDCNPITIPLETEVPVTELLEEGKLEDKRFSFRSLIGSLMYAMLCIRFDLYYSVGLLNRYHAWSSEML